ncbi:hypothetical protein J6590_001625 [Homalodisca vitripennis]|nr:hypothetical protein J6590_001625 [Homalodisca vitripennis]
MTDGQSKEVKGRGQDEGLPGRPHSASKETWGDTELNISYSFTRKSSNERFKSTQRQLECPLNSTQPHKKMKVGGLSEDRLRFLEAMSKLSNKRLV